MDAIFLGQRIREARERLGMSQDELAGAVSKDRKAIWEYEAGKRKLAAIDLADFSQALSVPITYFFDGTIDLDSLDQTLLQEFRRFPSVEAKLAVIRLVKTALDLVKSTKIE